MQTIDQRILIPAPPDAVWAYISDIRENPQWMKDCEAVAFISQNHQGPGTRWRSTLRKGHDAVVQVTAWYNGLGYEYTFVDGMPYKQSVGRIRLQEIPEGTVVQWTFSFEPKGLFTGARQIESTIADSLRALYKILQTAGTKRPLEAKSLMRDDPGVEARSAYKPRHPSDDVADGAPIGGTETDTKPKKPAGLTTYEPPIREGDNRQIPIIAEPPMDEGDTRPRPAVSIEAPAPPPATEREILPAVPFDEPDFLQELNAAPPPVPADQVRFMPPTPARIVVEEPPLKVDDTKPVPARTPPVEPVAQPPADTPAAAASASAEMPVVPAERPPAMSVYTPPAINVMSEPPREISEDTASIWDVFGLPRPSETQELRAIAAERAASEPPRAQEAHPPRAGLRAFQRRRIVNLRRPDNK
ncbi:MAG: SRPBCC family protein [bacterium]|nr:SRPBCC family protein [bacterium]